MNWWKFRAVHVNLAWMISYLVSGPNIDEFGDAHADDGLCNCVRKGRATGSVVDGRFIAEHLQLVDDSKR